jgi:two-component system sensor histidine kinase BarA
MGYRSLKRVLGETSLERKCRLLFGACLLLLILGAFWWVDSIAENLVIETTRSKGRDRVDMLMLKSHFETWVTKREPGETAQDTDARKFLRKVIDDLEKNQAYSYEVLTLEQDYLINDIAAKSPRDAKEVEILQRLKLKIAEREAEQAAAAAEAKSPEPPLPADIPVTTRRRDVAPLYDERVVRPAESGQNQFYQYYEPVYFSTNCKGCHFTPVEVGAISASEASGMYGIDVPLHVIKVEIPYKETQDAINNARAILIAVAILTVFLSMVALYVIVRYVIVKPLQHLRDVSDEVSRGKTELRAEIHTGDEFEELATSFNRMLRHMTETQSELQQVNEELDTKVDELAQLNMRLYEMNRLKDDFLANMSHELRTPLNSIIGFSEVLQGIDSLNDKQKRYALNIQKSGRLLLEMINDILDLAKMEAGKMDVRPSEFHVEMIVGAQCDMVRSLTEEKNIDLGLRAQPDLPPMYQDQSKVQQILTNLLSNAIKFTPEGGRITVSTSQDERGRLHLTVADTGVGIAREDREIIFEKFRQSTAVLGDDGLTREYSGTGLGLSIVKELCKLLGGEITFDSELGKGSTFSVTLPWTLADRARRDVQMTAKLDEMTRPRRADFVHAHEGSG